MPYDFAEAYALTRDMLDYDEWLNFWIGGDPDGYIFLAALNQRAGWL